METTTIKMGKRGTLVLPAKLRKQFGLGDGSMLTVATKDGAISIRPAYLYEPAVWSDEERSYFILINSMTREEWDANLTEVLQLGLDIAKIEGLAPNHRDTLPTDAEWDARVRTAIASRNEEKPSA